MAVFSFTMGEQPADESGPARRRSSVMAAVAGSLKKQVLLSLKPDLYLDGDAWHITGPIDFKYFPDTIFPIGNHTPDDSGEDLTKLWLDAWPTVTHSVFASLWAGLAFNLAHFTFLETEPGGLIDSNVLPGSDGGLYVGVGPTVVWDNRDNNLATYRGGRHGLKAIFYHGALGSAQDFSAFEVDSRHFFQLFGEHVLALQLLARFKTGDVPAARISKLGGEVMLRGFFAGRFNARHLIATQAEYRFPIWWRFRGAAFLGVGRVANRLSRFVLADLKVAGGAGLRYALIPEDRANLRLDVGYTNTGDLNFYFVFAEAF
ncbi:BamA/TamA family outer membrane protein [Myxococcota bacterium]